MKKEILYPTQEWLDSWVDKWMDAHPDERVEDFSALNEQAEAAWWDKQVDAGNPTPFDMNEEEKKAQKAAVKGMAKSDKERKTSTRERKPNEEKRLIIQTIYNALSTSWTAEIGNPEKEISFKIGENAYSVSLILHRAPKKA